MSKRIKCTKVTKDVGILGRFWSVDNLVNKGFIKDGKNNKCILTSKGKKELSKKKREFPFVSGMRD